MIYLNFNIFLIYFNKLKIFKKKGYFLINLKAKILNFNKLKFKIMIKFYF